MDLRVVEGPYHIHCSCTIQARPSTATCCASENEPGLTTDGAGHLTRLGRDESKSHVFKNMFWDFFCKFVFVGMGWRATHKSHVSFWVRDGGAIARRCSGSDRTHEAASSENTKGSEIHMGNQTKASNQSIQEIQSWPPIFCFCLCVHGLGRPMRRSSACGPAAAWLLCLPSDMILPAFNLPGRRRSHNHGRPSRPNRPIGHVRRAYHVPD